ncbi:transcriptional regulator NrdR [Candidatus Roizmanbacteria bacterium CG11_big_fil_rev_8_21_14_0_20_36_8]|uniref:Transcriptional repressor NrdR n=2 Tax=Candidatus Roizmaniibacteriota TaxID=1752723 RepID=A0A2M6IUM1_9BACT|nr:MAG: transcriptional regulator NrdR [Candidatus Roizmanbacteria bacterium CG11_big_fil_rev_8_21_14_0_20_36_8]PIZ66558.1 MAG: transcriptional regulator NrdR [Candidatus Roizmanbacteria bacterium CG_4_10_14_0_2_um_filter_36_9]
MKCLFCQNTNTEVIETRVSDNKTAIRRRRSCSDCKKRFTTYERIEEIPVLVIKRDKRRERFDRKKLLNGIFKAVGKTTVTADQVEEIVSLVEQSVANEGKTEIESTVIGNQVASHLKDIDKVAYIRFSSVFRRFLDVEEFERELKKLS